MNINKKLKAFLITILAIPIVLLLARGLFIISITIIGFLYLIFSAMTLS